MKRLFSIAAVFSLLLWLLLLIARVRCIGYFDEIGFPALGRWIDITLNASEVSLTVAPSRPTPERFRWNSISLSNWDAREIFSGFMVVSDLGRTSFQETRFPGIRFIRKSQAFTYLWPTPAATQKEFLHRLSGTSNATVTETAHILIVNWPPLLILPSLLPLCWFGSMYGRYHRRVYCLKNHLYLACGYDLRASSDKCPECGTPIPSPSPAGRGSG